MTDPERRPHSRDWPGIIAELEAAGVSNSELARLLNVTRSAVFHWLRSGREPSYYYGEKILQIHARHCRITQVSVTGS